MTKPTSPASRGFDRSTAIGIFALLVLASYAGTVAAQTPKQPIVYTIMIPEPDTHYAVIEAVVPTSGQAAVDLMMPIWSPGFYRVEDYAGKVEDLTAQTPSGAALEVSKPQKNRWQIRTQGSPSIALRYRLRSEQRSVTTNWVSSDLGVFNGGATFITLADGTPRPHEIRLQLPSSWKASASGLDPLPGGTPNAYRAPDYGTLVDSPIVSGNLDVHEFDVDGSRHLLVDAGERGQWDGAKGAADLERMVRAVHDFWGFLPFKRYVFLNVFRQGGGGLEHSNSTLLTASPRMTEPTPAWLAFVAHEYFHAFNVKRLRPIELGPFDYENPPRTSSLWISEGVTTYFAQLMLLRSSLNTTDQFLASMSGPIGQLQNAPGRLAQTLEQSSLEVWTNSNSGVNPAATTVSYYVKGNVAGFLLDVRIRRATNGARSLDDVMRSAYRLYGGARGFTADQFRSVAEDVAGADLQEWFSKTLASTEELDYSEMLEWYGLRFAAPESADHAERWKLVVKDDATAPQREHLRALVHR